jgi:hypothetical protein
MKTSYVTEFMQSRPGVFMGIRGPYGSTLLKSSSEGSSCTWRVVALLYKMLLMHLKMLKWLKSDPLLWVQNSIGLYI